MMIYYQALSGSSLHLMYTLLVNKSTHVSKTKKYRPHGALLTTALGCPQDEGPPLDILTRMWVLHTPKTGQNMLFQYFFAEKLKMEEKS